MTMGLHSVVQARPAPGNRFAFMVYCAADGVLSVLQETPDGAVSLGDVQTAKGGKNVAVDPQTHAVWTMSTDGTHSYAKSWVLP